MSTLRIPYSRRMLAQMDDAMRRARSADVALPSLAGGALVAGVVLTIYYVERVEGIHSLRLPLAALLVFAWWGRAMLLGRAARAVARSLWDAPIAPNAGRAVDVLRTSMVAGLGLWIWSWILVLGSLAGPIGVALVIPLFMLRGGVAPSWIARSACEAEGGFRAWWRAIADNHGERAVGAITELWLLLGAFGLAANLYAATVVTMVLLRAFGGLEIASLEAFLSLNNTFVLLSVASVAFVLLEPVRAALSAMAYVGARVREEGLDLRAAIQEAIEHSTTRRAARAALIAAAIVCASPSASAQDTAPPGWWTEEPGPTPVVEPRPEDVEVQHDIGEILSQPEFREFEEQRGLGLRQLLERILEWYLRQDHETPRIDGPDLGFLALPGAWFFIALAALLLVGVGVYLLLSTRRDRTRPVAAAAVPIDPRERAPSSFLDEAARLAEAGDLREALRALYLATLVSLDRRRMIAFDPHLTNWQYMRQMPRGAVRDSFGQFTRVFDHKWYGKESTSHADYERCRGLAREIVEAE